MHQRRQMIRNHIWYSIFYFQRFLFLNFVSTSMTRTSWIQCNSTFRFWLDLLWSWSWSSGLKLPMWNLFDQNATMDFSHPGSGSNETRPNCARKVREMILFNVLCTVYCGRGCVSLESEWGKGKNCCGNGTMEIRGSLRGPRGPKKQMFSLDPGMCGAPFF